MADEEYKEDEYQFVEPNGDSTFGDNEGAPLEEQRTEQSMEGRLKQLVFVAVGVLLAIFAIYKFIGLSSQKSIPGGGGKSALPTTSKAPTKPVKVVSTTPVVQPPESMPQPMNTVTKVVADERVKAKIRALQDTTTASDRKLSQLSNSVQQLQESISGLNDKMSEVASNLSMIDDLMKRQQISINQLQHPVKKKATAKIKPRPPMVYFIQALIPGRAWLVSPRGNTTTVVKGMRLKDYGRVEAIDVKQGQILTSSGRVIRFRAEDT